MCAFVCMLICVFDSRGAKLFLTVVVQTDPKYLSFPVELLVSLFHKVNERGRGRDIVSVIHSESAEIAVWDIVDVKEGWMRLMEQSEWSLIILGNASVSHSPSLSFIFWSMLVSLGWSRWELNADKDSRWTQQSLYQHTCPLIHFVQMWDSLVLSKASSPLQNEVSGYDKITFLWLCGA